MNFVEKVEVIVFTSGPHRVWFCSATAGGAGELQLTNWKLLCCQICTIISNVPRLTFLNLSTNPLRGVELDPSRAPIFSHIRRLVLTNTRVSWETVHTLTQHMPE